MYYRLSGMMLLIYAVPGAWIPVFSLRMEKELGFEPHQTAAAFAAWAASAIVASLIVGQIADRYLALEKCLSLAALACGGNLFVLAEMTTPLTVVLMTFVVTSSIVPLLTLSVTLSLRHLENPENQFGKVRMWGTLGWIVGCLLFGLWMRTPEWLPTQSGSAAGSNWLWQPSFADSLRLGGLVAFCLSAYCLTLPHTPPIRQSTTWLAPLGAIHLLKRRRFAVVVGCFFLMHMAIPFIIQQISLLLEQELQISDQWISTILTLGQWSEVFLMWALGSLTAYLGLKRTLLVGLAGWLVWITILVIGQPSWLVIASLTMNGVFITCYVIRAQVFVNREAGEDIRASAQGLVTMANGCGLILGNLLVGQVRTLFDKEFAPSFAVGGGIAFFAFLLLAFGFVSDKKVDPRVLGTDPKPPPSKDDTETAIAEVGLASGNVAKPSVSPIETAIAREETSGHSQTAESLRQ